MTEEIKTLFTFNERLHSLAEKMLETEIHDVNDKVFFEAFVIGKAFKSYEAVLLLCHNGFGEDAFVLTRTLFELMITNAYILQDDTEEMLMRYMHYDWVTRKEMYDYLVTKPEILKHLNESAALDQNASTVSEVDTGYKKAVAKYQYKRGSWSDKSIKGMSQAVGREDMYSTVYRLQCTMGHTNARSMNEYVSNEGQESILDVGPNWNLVREALVIVFDCFFHILKEADKQFSWNLDESLESLAKEYSEAVRILRR